MTLTHKDLQISKQDYDALVAVEAGLLSGAFYHMPEERKNNRTRSTKLLFNVGVWSVNEPCGTVCCIGGWVSVWKKFKDFKRDLTDRQLGAIMGASSSGQLYRLYHPSISRRRWNRITPKQAAQAIRNFLNGAGSNCWKGIKVA